MTTLRRLSAFYFFAFGSLGAVYPLLPLVFASHGLSATEIGWVMAMGPVVTLFAPALWGVIADAYHARALVLRVVAFGSALTTLSFSWATSFSRALLAMLVVCFFRAPIASLADSATYAVLGPENGSGFARIRRFGSIGFVVFVTLSGYVDGSHHEGLLIGLGVATYAMCGVVAFGFGSPVVEREPRVFARALDHVRTSGLGLLFLPTALYYAAHAVFDNLFALHVQHLGHPDSLVGTAYAAAVTAEVVMMSRAREVLAGRRTSVILVFSSGVAALRWLLIALVSSPELLVAVQLLHAITFGLWYVALVAHVQDRTPAELRSSVQGLLYTALSLGTMAGLVGGGWLLDHASGAWMFGVAALAAVLAMSLYGVVVRREAA